MGAKLFLETAAAPSLAKAGTISCSEDVAQLSDAQLHPDCSCQNCLVWLSAGLWVWVAACRAKRVRQACCTSSGRSSACSDDSIATCWWRCAARCWHLREQKKSGVAPGWTTAHILSRQHHQHTRSCCGGLLGSGEKSVSVCERESVCVGG